MQKPSDLLPSWLSLKVKQDYFHLRSTMPLQVAATAPCGGGMTRVRNIISLLVDKNQSCCHNPAQVLRAGARKLGLTGSFVGMLTGVPLDRVRVAVRESQGTVAVALVTAGGHNLSAAGMSPEWPGNPPCGTINTIVVIDAHLTGAALLNVMVVAAEAKALALRERGIITREGYPATGTSSDAVVVGCTGRGPQQRYGGPVTLAGHLAGAAVLEATRAAVDSSRMVNGRKMP